jgi:CDGSH-type Zn-finger protein
LKLEGPCEVRAPDGTLLMRGGETALCRCGHSGKRPFCDGTHRSIGFTA